MTHFKKILYTICILFILFAAWSLWQIHQSDQKSKELYDGLAEQAHEESSEASSEASSESDESSAAEESEASATEDELAAVEEGGLENSWIQDLQEQNDELVGWITVPNTVIDYPVMQTAEDNDYYLTHDFDKHYDDHGAPFLDYNCTLDEADNLIIYGHHMMDGTMFEDLLKYEDADFAESNDPILFETPEETYEYEVIFAMVMSYDEAVEFPYYKYIYLSDPEEYQEFLDGCSQYAVWERDDVTEAGTPLLTLSTCEYTKTNGRFVLVARLIDD